MPMTPTPELLTTTQTLAVNGRTCERLSNAAHSARGNDVMNDIIDPNKIDPNKRAQVCQRIANECEAPQLKSLWLDMAQYWIKRAQRQQAKLITGDTLAETTHSVSH
jgi:hypothetical protein